ncbi:MAG TPA: DivIVA domain-containing protein [Mycobacteriales bacterium]
MGTALMHHATPLVYLFGLLIVGGLLFLLASFVFGRGERLAPMPPDLSPVVLPSVRPVSGRDLRRLRISVVLRGYRMGEVDWILDQVAAQLDERDRELARLRAELGEPDPAPDPNPDPVSDPVAESSPEGSGAEVPVHAPGEDGRHE